MRLPQSASDTMMPIEEGPPSFTEAYIPNPYAGKELLTFAEALDLLNMISGELMADARQRSS